MKDRLILSVGIATVMIASISISNAFAGGPRMDWDERFEDIPGAPECWVDALTLVEMISLANQEMMNVQTRTINTIEGG